MPEKKIKPGQVMSLRTGLRVVDPNMSDDACLYIVNKIVYWGGFERHSLSEFTRDEWREIRNEMYPHHEADDWTVGVEFKRRVAALYEQYREENTGQMRLF